MSKTERKKKLDKTWENKSNEHETQSNKLNTIIHIIFISFIQIYSKMSLLRPPNIKTTSLLRPVFASPKWNFPYDIVFNIKTTSLMRPLLGSPKGGLNIGILLYTNLKRYGITELQKYDQIKFKLTKRCYNHRRITPKTSKGKQLLLFMTVST